MSGQYKFDAGDEKVDEVELVTAEETLPASKWQQKTTKEGSTWRFVPTILHLINTALLVTAVVILIFIALQNNTDSCTTTGTEDSTSGTAASLQQTTCDTSSLINETNQAKYHIAWLLENRTDLIVQLMQQMYNDQTTFYDNATNMMTVMQINTENSLAKLTNIIGTLSNHKDNSIATAAVIDDILVVVKELLQLQNASLLLNSINPVSCQDIKKALPNSPSGYYHVNSRNIYCNMEELCGSEGGWTRLAYLDMSDSTESCPTGFQLYQNGGVRGCGRTYSSGPSCTPSLKFSSNGISYSEICGRVFGYQKGSPDAVDYKFVPISDHNDLNSYYVDGVSLTRGSPRQHVWTFMAGLWENQQSLFNCPCNSPPGGDQVLQDFVGSHYFCESAVAGVGWQQIMYTEPLWDGKDCTGTQEELCCTVDGLPWFHRQYDNSTTDYLELRVCGDQTTADEDVPVGFYEIYVK